MSSLWINLLIVFSLVIGDDYQRNYNTVIFANKTDSPVVASFKFKNIKTKKTGEFVSYKHFYKKTKTVNPHQKIQFSTLEDNFYFTCFGNTENTRLIYQQQNLILHADADEEDLVLYDMYQIVNPHKEVKIEIVAK